MLTGVVKGSEIKKNRDADKKSLLLQVQITDPDDVQTVQSFLASGEDWNPPDESRVVYLSAGKAFKIAVAIDDGVEPDSSLEKGEKEIYSTDNGKKGERKAKHRFKKDGVHVINDGEDFAVRFTKMEEAFNTLKDDHNSLVNKYNDVVNKFIAHMHGTSVGNTTTPLPPLPTATTPSQADMSEAKIEEIKVP
jgi:hypothetical protein